MIEQSTAQIDQIKSQLNTAFAPSWLELQDQSDRHRHHPGRKQAPAGSGHYDLVIVSEQFESKTLIQRHRLIYSVLADQIPSQIHALTIRAYTPAEWRDL
ncbi:MAG: BolA family protein [Pseudanabaenaceae cyanobacterium bins.68]|nr:BolA family protein [Pseudanabaenaceae cyanobacterium bins.68]